MAAFEVEPATEVRLTPLSQLSTRRRYTPRHVTNHSGHRPHDGCIIDASADMMRGWVQVTYVNAWKAEKTLPVMEARQRMRGGFVSALQVPPVLFLHDPPPVVIQQRDAPGMPLVAVVLIASPTEAMANVERVLAIGL